MSPIGKGPMTNSLGFDFRSLDKVAERLAHISRKILREKYLPAMLRVGPWLGDQITLDQ